VSIIVIRSSLLFQLRCQLHTEIAKCEEDQEHLQVAIDHIKKVLPHIFSYVFIDNNRRRYQQIKQL